MIRTLGLPSSLEGDTARVPTVLREVLWSGSKRVGRRSERGAGVQWCVLWRGLVGIFNGSTPLGSPVGDTLVCFHKFKSPDSEAPRRINTILVNI